MYLSNKHQKVQVQPKWHKTAQVQEHHCKQHKNKTLPLTNTQTFSMHLEPRTKKRSKTLYFETTGRPSITLKPLVAAAAELPELCPWRKKEGRRKEGSNTSYQIPLCYTTTSHCRCSVGLLSIWPPFEYFHVTNKLIFIIHPWSHCASLCNYVSSIACCLLE